MKHFESGFYHDFRNLLWVRKETLLITQPTFQGRINVVSTLKDKKVDLTLKIKQNQTLDFQCCTTSIQRQCSTLKQRQKQCCTTLKQPCTTSVQRCINVIST